MLCKDRVAGGIILIICAGLLNEGLKYPPDSRLFPLMMLAFLMIGALIMIARPNKNPGEDGGDPKRVGVTLAMCVLYVVLIEPLGYYIATTMFITAFMAMMGLRRSLLYAAAIVGINLGMYLLFVRQLHVPVPIGIFFP